MRTYTISISSINFNMLDYREGVGMVHYDKAKL